MKLLWLFAAVGIVFLAALTTPSADGATRVFRDGDGRAIRFNDQTGNAPLARYANVLRRAIHGDEIERLTVWVVPRREVPRVCQTPNAVACHIRSGSKGPRIVISPGPRAERLLLHEYGHHIDIHIGNGARTEPNGTTRWWGARGITRKVRNRSLRNGYGGGWHSAVPELFAEDYAKLNGASGWMIRGLRPPSRSVLRALRADLKSALADRAPAPRVGRRTISQRGSLPFADRNLVLFRTGAYKERIAARITLTRGRAALMDATLVCNGRRLGRARIAVGRPAEFARSLPAGASCRVSIKNIGDGGAYALTISRLRLYSL